MASYDELSDLRRDPALRKKITVAIAVAIDFVNNEAVTTPNHTARIAWAKDALADLGLQAKRAHWMVLALNKNASVTQIQSASDTAVQAQVDSVVDLLA